MSFEEQAALLRLFLQHREEIVERIEGVLNAQRKPAPYLQDRALLSLHFEDCFFAPREIAGHARLRGQLEEAYWAGGFQPRRLSGMYNDLIHPAEMMIRGFHFWQQTRWPGRNGRIHYAHTLFNVYLLRCCEFLSLHIWDDHPSRAAGRLLDLQSLLDALWRGSPDDQPAIVRDARWLIPLAQSLPTDALAPYLEVAQKVAETLPEADALEIQRAQVRMLGGHLTSQIRHHCLRDGVAMDEHSLNLRTRTSNALDFALLVQGLVPLLRAYDAARLGGDEGRRLTMAGAIFQGVSADPELFLQRLDLLRPYSMIEHVFVADQQGRAEQGSAEQGRVAYSPLGLRHVRLLDEYGALLQRLAAPLREDLPRFRPVQGGYSPYGAIFGYPSTLTELMALKTLERDAETRFSLEDVFEDSSDEAESAAKLAWVDGWRKMPHIDPQIQRMYDYPQPFAEDIHRRIERELAPRESKPAGRLHIAASGETVPNGAIPELPAQYIVSSSDDRAKLLFERQEAHFLVTYETPGGMIAVKKELLTEVLGEGHDAKITGLPHDAAEVLRLMCAGLAERGESIEQG